MIRREGGFTFVELIVASAILITVSAAVLWLLHDGLAAAPVLEEATDLQQRARVSIDALAAELRAAAAGPPSGPLSRYFAAVEPRAAIDPPGTASASALTVRYVPPNGAHSRLVQPLLPGVPTAFVDTASPCPLGTTACGFNASTTAVVFDPSGAADFVSVDAIAPGVLTVSDPIAGRAQPYPAGDEIAEALQVSFIFDPAARQLRRAEGGGDFVLADNINAVTFEYFAADMSRLPLALFGDGPFVGAGSTAFDADLLRIRTVRATLRFDTGVDRLRGIDTRLFARPGTASGARVLPDLVARLDVALRNGG